MSIDPTKNIAAISTTKRQYLLAENPKSEEPSHANHNC